MLMERRNSTRAVQNKGQLVFMPLTAVFGSFVTCIFKELATQFVAQGRVAMFQPMIDADNGTIDGVRKRPIRMDRVVKPSRVKRRRFNGPQR